APVWKAHVPLYFFTGGLAGASSVLAFGARVTGNHRLARAALLAAAAGLLPSPVLLIDDLGRPERFYNMLRVFKPTSPLSVGSWLLSAFALPVGIGFADEVPALVPRPLRPLVHGLAPVGSIAGAVLGSGVATYTAVLIADTAVPSWHAAHPELPFVFAGSALAGASGLALVFAPTAQTAPARRLAVLGAALEVAAAQRMEHR